MKITKSTLKRIIREELQNVLKEQDPELTAMGVYEDLKSQRLLSRDARLKPQNFVELVMENLLPTVREALENWGAFSAKNLGLTLPKDDPDDKPVLDKNKFRCYQQEMRRQKPIKDLMRYDEDLNKLADKQKDDLIARWLKKNYLNFISTLQETMPRGDIMQKPLFPVAEKIAKKCGAAPEQPW